MADLGKATTGFSEFGAYYSVCEKKKTKRLNLGAREDGLGPLSRRIEKASCSDSGSVNSGRPTPTYGHYDLKENNGP